MEIRRIEGVFLQHALETSQGFRAENISKQISLKFLSTVPESLLEAFSEGSLLRGYVVETYEKNLKILLSNNQEILAENSSTLGIQKGDHLELVLESKNPISLRITLLQRRTNIDQILDVVFNPSRLSLFNFDNQDINLLMGNSGVFYERKLFGFLLGNISLGNVLEDAKARIIQNLLTLAQDTYNQLNIREQFNQNLDFISDLFLYVMNKTDSIVETENLLKGLYLENLNNWEFVQLVRFIENSGNREILRALERGDRNALIQLLHKEIESLRDTPAGRSIQLVFERVKTMTPSLKDEELKEHLDNFIKALDSGSLEDLRESHKKLVNLLEDRRKLLPLREKIERDGLQWINRLNTIIQIQRIMVNEGFLVLPFEYEGRKGGVILKPNKEEYKIFINLNYPEGFISAILSCPKLKEAKNISLSFYTNSEIFYSKIETNKHVLESMLKEEDLRIKEFKVNFISMVEDLKKVIKQNFYDTNLYLVV